MSQANKEIAARWFEAFWGSSWQPEIADDLAAPDMVLHHSVYEPMRGRTAVIEFMTEFRRAFPDLKFWTVGDLIAEGDYVVCRWKGGGSHTGPAFCGFRTGSLPAASGRSMRFSGTSVLRVAHRRVAEELGQEDALTLVQQLGPFGMPEAHVAVASAESAVPLGGFWAQTLGPKGSLPHGWNRLPPRAASRQG